MLGLDQAIDAARGIDNQVRGTIRLACFVTLAPFILPEVISQARAAHPYLDIEVDEVDAEEARDALRSGRAELSVGYDFAYGDGIEREVIATTPAHVLLPADHPLAGDGGQVSLRDLAGERLILLDLPHSRDYFLQLLSSAGLEPEIAHRTRNYETVRARSRTGTASPCSTSGRGTTCPTTAAGSRCGRSRTTCPLSGGDRHAARRPADRPRGGACRGHPRHVSRRGDDR